MAGSLYIDLGANAGETVLSELISGRHGVIWAFEPAPQLAEGLRRRFGSAVVVVEAAAWVEDGGTRLYLGHVLSATIVEGKRALPGHPEFGISYDRHIDVATVDFANWLAQAVNHEDSVIVKMDIEGAEYRVLDRLVETGAIDLIDELRCEFHSDRFPQYAGVHGRLVRSVCERTTLVPWK